MTEGILYNFLPALLTYISPKSEDPLTDLSPETCAQVASAVLSVSCLLNAPPGFLEFLLCVPWQKLNLLHPGSNWDAMLPSLLVSSTQRQDIINTAIPSSMLPCVLSFLYLEEYQSSLPPMLVPTHDTSGEPLPAARGSVRTDSAKSKEGVRPSGPMTTEVCHPLPI